MGLRDHIINRLDNSNGKIISKLSPENKEELRTAIKNPKAWVKGVNTPEGHIEPWELLIFGVSGFLSAAMAGFNNQDYLYKDYYHINPNKLSIAGVISSTWDAINDPFIGTWMDRKRFGPQTFRTILRIAAIVVNLLNFLKLIGDGLTEWQHIVILILLNFISSVFTTLEAVAKPKLLAGISPYTQQRGRMKVWTNVGQQIGYPIANIANYLLAFKETLHLNTYQIFVYVAAVGMPLNMFASFILSYVRQRVDFNTGGARSSMLPTGLHEPPRSDEEIAREQAHARMIERRKKELEEQNAAVRIIREQKRLVLEEEALYMQGLRRKDRRIYVKARAEARKAFGINGELEMAFDEIDENTGLPKLGLWQSFAVVKHNPYFIANTIAGFITVFTPSVDERLMYQYLIPELKIGKLTANGLLIFQLREQIGGLGVTISKPFGRHLVNLVGGPIRAHQLNSAVSIITAVLQLLIGYNKPWKLVALIVLRFFVFITGDIDTVAGDMMNYQMLDYTELKTGMRSEGVIFSFNALFTKIINNNIGTVTGNGFLGWTGYKGDAVTIQPARFMKYVWPMFNLSMLFDSFVWLIARSTVRFTPEDALRTERLLAERKAMQESTEE
ncbi:MAG: MFS transporter [Oscillospiraceae bacterium]|jgi:Na+/melibiose symporter-like transporter|nr:MFS transporter [Oscillospiraceae bacterium]